MAVPDPPSPRGLTRRRLLQGAGSAALALAGGGVAEAASRATPLPTLASFAINPAGPVRRFHSRPDLRPPTVTMSGGAGTGAAQAGADPGFLFLGPGPVSLTGSQQFGPLIVDGAGEPVWFAPLPAGMEVTNFARWQVRSRPVLAWWEGEVLPSGYGHGEAVILDHAYRQLARVQASGRRAMDLHALTVTPRGTALFTCHPDPVPADLSSVGGPPNGRVFESIIQEVDIATGRLLFEWRSLQHIPVRASHQPLGEPYDYLHVNSIQPLPDGNLLISARHTWAVYKLDRRTGDVIWTLGGKDNQFQLGPEAGFAWQHDARRLPGGVLTLFDNATDGPIRTERQSRAIVLDLDESRRRAALRDAYPSPHRLVVGAMGSVQILPSGDVIVGWGVAPYTNDFAASGELLSEFALPDGMYSYRAVLLPWTATPHDRPAIAAGADEQLGATILYASWNGATGVAGWRVQAGPQHDRLRPIGIAARRGFETALALPPRYRYASVTALDGVGGPLGRSPTIRLGR